jgi:hypothetical protein
MDQAVTHQDIMLMSLQFIAAIVSATAAHLVALLALTFYSSTIANRLTWFLAVLVLVCTSISQADRASNWGEQLCFYMFGFGLYANCFFLLRPVVVPPSLRLSECFRLSAAVLFSPRMGIPRKSLPAFSRKDPNWVPSRCRFLLQQAFSVTWKYLVHHYVLNNYQPYYYMDDFSSPKNHLLRRFGSIDPREAVVRAYFTFKTIFVSYLCSSTAHSVASLIAVACFNDAPASWPPLFGSLGDAYTIRGYYNQFWHKTMRKAFTVHGRFLAHRICQLSPSSRYRRHVVTLSALLVSGVMHAVAGSVSWRCRNFQQIKYYLAVAAAIGFEDNVQTLYGHLQRTCATRWCRNASTKNSRPNQVAVILEKRSFPSWKIPGYVWVLFFQFWMIPNAVYPNMVCTWATRNSVQDEVSLRPILDG